MRRIDRFSDHINIFFGKIVPEFNCISNIHDSSYDATNHIYLIDNPNYNLYKIVSMDTVANKGYSVYKNATTKHKPNTVDAFMIDKNDNWYFIEFKNCMITGKGSKKTRDNIEKKCFHNLLMLIDIMNKAGTNENISFDNSAPLDFIKKHCIFILVISSDKNPSIYDKIKDCANTKQTYTLPELEKYKQYYFKDVYVYTSEYFINNFLKEFEY